MYCSPGPVWLLSPEQLTRRPFSVIRDGIYVVDMNVSTERMIFTRQKHGMRRFLIKLQKIVFG